MDATFHSLALVALGMGVAREATKVRMLSRASLSLPRCHNSSAIKVRAQPSVGSK